MTFALIALIALFALEIIAFVWTLWPERRRPRREVPRQTVRDIQKPYDLGRID